MALVTAGSATRILDESTWYTLSENVS